jgi:hypothetical protein
MNGHVGVELSSTRLAHAAGIALSLLAVACGPAGSSGTPASSSDAPGGGGATKKIDKHDQARAQAIRIRLSDLPAGWVRGNDRDDRKSSGMCDFDSPSLTLTGESSHRGDEFAGPDHAVVGATSAVYASTDEAKRSVALALAGDLSTCLAGELAKGIRQAGKHSGLTIDQYRAAVTKLPRHGAEQYTWRIAIPFSTTRAIGTLYVDVFVFRVDRAITAGLLFGGRKPFPASLEVHLLDRLEQRARASRAGAGTTAA